MAASEAFERVCEQLEVKSSLDRLATRGTIRLILKHAGLEARTVTSSQVSAVVSKLLPAELTSRGVEDAEAICSVLASTLAGMKDEPAGDSPESVFERLGGKIQ